MPPILYKRKICNLLWNKQNEKGKIFIVKSIFRYLPKDFVDLFMANYSNTDNVCITCVSSESCLFLKAWFNLHKASFLLPMNTQRSFYACNEFFEWWMRKQGLYFIFQLPAVQSYEFPDCFVTSCKLSLPLCIDLDVELKLKISYAVEVPAKHSLILFLPPLL